MEADTDKLQVSMAEVARRFGLLYSSLRAATKMGLTPFKRSGDKASWVATVADVDKWVVSDEFKIIERVKP